MWLRGFFLGANRRGRKRWRIVLGAQHPSRKDRIGVLWAVCHSKRGRRVLGAQCLSRKDKVDVSWGQGTIPREGEKSWMHSTSPGRAGHETWVQGTTPS